MNATGRKPSPDDGGGSRLPTALAFFGLAAAILGFPVALNDAWPPVVIWILVGIALLTAGAGVWTLVRGPRKAARPSEAYRALTVATEELWALAERIRSFIDEHTRMAPVDTPTGFLGRQASKTRAWEQRMIKFYGDNYRHTALEAFDEAIRHNAVTRSGRTVVEGDSVAQIRQVPDLLERAARRLERLAEDEA